MTMSEPWVDLPGHILGPSLTAAGLAAWVLSANGEEEAAGATVELQDELDEALRAGITGPARVSRETAERAVSLWERAAGLLEAWSATAGGDPHADREAARLRTRVASLRRALGSA
ncbi:hypothetical protein JQN72_09725 [Phycicoccus sp. CSK15P-2]|uniref:hypothetical protein n=1 Tax=Phycicoccus sp. CSK15P-2 TaxID=2807627 RepID=UPI001952549A|nr:hypothetical protein [Phycicoccus sp. CSK15P-2]MBM6404517.1 hypothetical protein [Phycicoccus sp. CSK15P-2]